jgi:hypothetical protein
MSCFLDQNLQHFPLTVETSEEHYKTKTQYHTYNIYTNQLAVKSPRTLCITFGITFYCICLLWESIVTVTKRNQSWETDTFTHFQLPWIWKHGSLNAICLYVCVPCWGLNRCNKSLCLVNMNILAPKMGAPKHNIVIFLGTALTTLITFSNLWTPYRKNIHSKHISINLRLTLSHIRFEVFTAVHCQCGSHFCVMGQAMQNSFPGIWNRTI